MDRGFHNALIRTGADYFGPADETVANLRAALSAIQCEAMLTTRGSATVAQAHLNRIADMCAKALRESR